MDTGYDRQLSNLSYWVFMKNIYVITHTESIHHVEGRVGGWYDTGLTERGKVQALQVAQRMRELITSHTPTITSSDLLRAKETASVVASEFGCEFQTNPGLREKSYGVAEGKPQAWLEERIRPAAETDRINHVVIEGGESLADFIVRVYRAVDEIIADENPIHIIVTHGYALTFVVARWIKMPATSAGHVNFRSRSGGITHLQEDDYWQNRTLVQLSETTHLIETAGK